MDHTDNARTLLEGDTHFTLYKFRKIDKWLIESLVNRSLYFAQPKALNDPFDCCIDLKQAIGRAASSAKGDRKTYLSSLLENPVFFKTWEARIANLGVCSFSRANRHPLLWSHYADEHKGLCLEFRFRTAYLLNRDLNLTTAGNVEYHSEPLKAWLKKSPLEDKLFVFELIHKYLKTKSPAWKYESEARMLGNKPGVVTFNRQESFLNRICFGIRTPDADISLIRTIAQTYSDCNRFSQMTSDGTEFGFREVPFISEQPVGASRSLERNQT